MGGGKGEDPKGVRECNERDCTGTPGPGRKATVTNGKGTGVERVSDSNYKVRYLYFTLFYLFMYFFFFCYIFYFLCCLL